MSFELIVEGATVPPEDPDGVYTCSTSGGRPVEGPGFRIVHGTGTLRTMTGLATTDQYTDEDTVGGTSALPDTGGIALAALGAGVLLIAGGVLARSL